jgi:hypothetical protein
MTKLLFLALWYCAIFPGALFMCAFALFINYFTDRFSLMRSWKRPPHLGTRISKFSRRYFFSLAILAMAVMSSYYWSGFPFDNLCMNDSFVDSEYVGSFTINANDATGLDHVPVQVTISPSSFDFRYCLQNFLKPSNEHTFPFIPDQQAGGDEWMTEVSTVHRMELCRCLAILTSLVSWYPGRIKKL